MRRTRVLLVDDDPSVLLTLAANLDLEGFDVESVDDAERALAILAERPPDIVLSDIRMPGMDGIDLFRAIKRAGVPIPVVLMTAFALEDQVDAVLTEGVFTVLPKPFAIDHVTRVLLRASRHPIVLVVDRAVTDADATAEALRRRGVRARAASNTADALEALRSALVDVCVIDSPELVDSIRSADESVALVLTASDSDAASLARVASSGVVAFVPRPVDAERLARVIANARGRRAAVGRGRAARAAGGPQ
jgi:DNA-binding NtrC family response regulator